MLVDWCKNTEYFSHFPRDGRFGLGRKNESLDNLQPLLLNNSNDGADWKAHGVTAKQVWGRQRNTQLGSEALFEVTEGIIRQQIRKGNLPEE